MKLSYAATAVLAAGATSAVAAPGVAQQQVAKAPIQLTEAQMQAYVAGSSGADVNPQSGSQGATIFNNGRTSQWRRYTCVNIQYCC